MARTTSDLVIAILQKDYDSVNSPDISGYIDSASLLVDKMILCRTGKGIVTTDSEAEIIERWLSAHAYAMSDKPYKAKTNLRSSAVYEGETKLRLEATRYGQFAMGLDDSGCLEKVNAGNKRVGGRWLGRRPSDQTDYEDRR